MLPIVLGVLGPTNTWDLPTYLEQLCYKAGLPKDAWKDKDARLFIFSADIIK